MGRSSRFKNRKLRKSVGGGLSAQPAEKISARLLALIAPFKDDEAELEDYRRLVALASTAWNITVLPPEMRAEAWAAADGGIPASDRALAMVLVQKLIERKEQLFPDDKRVIAHSDVIEEEDSFRVLAASLPAWK